MRARVEDLRRDGRRIAVVPTMGALHEGHLSLVRAARERADIVILTIFVNPTQFGPERRPSRLSARRSGRHREGARRAAIDLAFCPEATAMYPPGAQTFIEVRELQKPLCGASRPGHFAGVATIVTKLFNITQAAPRGVRREGLPAARDHPPHGARPRLRHRDRRRADRPRGGRSRDVVAQRVSVGRAARRGARAEQGPRRRRGGIQGRRARCRRARRRGTRAARGRAARAHRLPRAARCRRAHADGDRRPAAS